MANYIEAFRQGLQAAEAAEIAKKEINSVFLEFDRQLREVSQGKIGIDRREFYVREEGVSPFTSSIAALQFTLYGRNRDTYWAIVAYNPMVPESPVKELATWSQDRAGYPCKISFANVSRSCEDRESLEIYLAELLRDPIIGEKLFGLMRLDPPPAKEEGK